MRVLVCGGRDYTNADFLFTTLARLHADRPFTMVIEGGAKGADALAFAWAVNWLGPNRVTTYLPNWNAHGSKAGVIRNQAMLDDGKPDLVVAFPGGRGTADMMRRAVRAGVALVMVGEPPANA